MCQLTFLNIPNLELMRFVAFQQLYVNTATQHKDGFGIFTPTTGIVVSEKEPRAFLELGKLVDTAISRKGQAMLHVRAASNKTKIGSEFNHPFESDDLILIHNGTLEPKDKKIVIPDDKIDSNFYLEYLQDEYTKNKKNITQALQKSMENFYGKFAFIIFEKSTRKYYVVRGKSAQLHIFSFINENNKLFGYVVNTEYLPLKEIANLSISWATKLGLNFKYDSNIVKFIRTEVIYELTDNGIIACGELKENIKPTQNYNSYQQYLSGGDADADSSPEYMKKFYKFMERFEVNPQYLDVISVYITGSPILELEYKELEDFSKKIDLITKRNDPNINTKIDIWKGINKLNYTAFQTDYHNEDFPFPYMFASVKQMRAAKLRVANDPRIIKI